MGIPAAAQPEPLLRYLNIQAVNDADFRVLLHDSANEAAAIINSYGDGIGANVRRAQLDLAQAQQETWRKVGDSTKIAIGDGVDAAAESVAYMDELLLNSVGGSSSFWSASVLAQARQGIDNLISRNSNGYSLSENVYKGRAYSNNLLGRRLDALVASGASAKEIAQRVSGLIRPDVAGGVSYAAMRLGRSELNNAFHTTSVRLNAEKPWVNGMKWNLSSSHPEGDICDSYAYDVHWRGHEQGVFKVSEVPSKPHPQCLCYVTPEVDSDDVIARKFARGDYDDYLGRMGCGGA